jgi:hypothetical protein
MLTDEHKQKLMVLLSFLECYHREGDEFLDHIIIGDETEHQTVSSTLKNGITTTLRQKNHENSSRHVQLQKSCPAFFGTGKAFF